ncbi:MAG TPA: amino acid ABC transporter permease [Bauldia sp.]|nr:amino acid ABC transporter permease [Bauldia sp.]
MATGDGLRDRHGRSRGTSLLYDPAVRGYATQALVAIVLVLLIGWFVSNTIENLQRANIASGFGFLWNRAGFDISQTLIPYTAEDTYARAFLVGLLNTLLVAFVGVVLASILGFLAGVARLAKNPLIAGIAAVYVETLRNIPVLLQLLFWYRAVLSVLPAPRQAIALPFGSYLSNRGLLLPNLIAGEGFAATVAAAAVAILAVIVLAWWARRRQMATGKPFPVFFTGLAIIVILPLLTFAATGAPLTVEFPELKGFNFVGGFHVFPEFMALVLGLTLYTATFIAEIVRAGILAVPHGQTEAAYALGFRPGLTLRLVIIPQALRVIIPPLTSQYLNLTKNSSLAVAIAYPDLVSVFAGTVLNQTGQAVEAIFITMMVYLAISLATSLFMNWFNRHVALVER